MRILLIFFLLFISSLTFSQKLYLNDLIKSFNQNIDEFDTFINKKGYIIYSQDISNKSYGNSYFYKVYGKKYTVIKRTGGTLSIEFETTMENYFEILKEMQNQGYKKVFKNKNDKLRFYHTNGKYKIDKLVDEFLNIGTIRLYKI